MLQVLSCIKNDHSYGLLALAVLICATGSWTGIKTLIRALGEPEDRARLTWIALSSVAMASAVWATHFVAVLAYRPGVPVGWDVDASIASLMIAISCTALALLAATSRRLPFAPEIGGAMLGGGIAAMHFVGMQAFEVAGRIQWNHVDVAAAIAMTVGFGMLALNRAARPRTALSKYAGAFALMLAICCLHFTAMAAVHIVPDPSIVITSEATETSTFGYIAASVAMMVIGTSFMAFLIDRRVSSVVLTRMRKLANATTEGILITRDGVIADSNDRFIAMIGMSLASIRGCAPDKLWTPQAPGAATNDAPEFDTEIVASSGERIPVHVVTSLDTVGERIYAVRDLRSKRAAEARIAHMAHHDALTGLANRSTFVAAVDAAIAAGRPFAVLYVDLDRFKDINDGSGHAAGDAVLVETATRLRAAMPSSTVARLGGDEFAVLKPLEGRDGDGADKLAAVLQQPILVDGAALRAGASIGVATFPEHGDDTPSLINNADMGMYAAKAERKCGVRRFDASMGESVRRRRILAQDLSSAVESGEFELHYQVQTAVETGATIGFEALLRWHHPRLGNVPPCEFIPIAEENGTIIPIGEWVMHRACQDATLWPGHLKVAVNLSPAQFHHDVEGMILSALVRSGLSPRRLEIEITESLLINDLDATLAKLNRIKAMGLSIAMDDFGTGYSSLSSLQAFPFDKIKIDRSFVDKMDHSPQAAAIVRAVVNLGLSLDIPVLAEGVEKQAHLDMLKKQGCTSAQGYLMGRPTPLAGTNCYLQSSPAFEAA